MDEREVLISMLKCAGAPPKGKQRVIVQFQFRDKVAFVNALPKWTFDDPIVWTCIENALPEIRGLADLHLSLWRDGKVVPPRKVDLCDSTLKSILVSSYKMNDGYFFVLSESSSDCLLCDTGKIIGVHQHVVETNEKQSEMKRAKQ